MTNRTLKVIGIVLVIVAVVVNGLYKKRERSKLSNESVSYVIGEVLKYEAGVKGASTLLVTYNYNHKEYRESIFPPDKFSNLEVWEMNNNDLDKFYLVKVLKSNPEIFEFLEDHPVRDTTLIQPINGWDELPE